MSKLDRIFTSLFIILESLIFIVFLYLDFSTSHDSDSLKYLSIVIIILFLSSCLIAKIKINKITFIALIFTLIAATFLLLIDKYYSIGLTSFIIVQSLYFYEITKYISKRNIKTNIILRLLIIIISLIYLIYNKEVDVSLSLIYILFFILNIISLFFSKIKERRLLLLGLIIFLCCDLCVGLYNFGNYIDIPINIKYTLESLTENLMWLFYLPSQVIITLYTKKVHFE